MIRITSKREGFRRCGIAHSKTPTEYPVDKFSKAELEALEAEPNLIVEEVEGTSGGGNSRPNAKESIALAEAAETVAALDELEKGEERKTVLDAIDKRRAELTAE